MKSILQKQSDLQNRYQSHPIHLASVGAQYDYIKDTLFFLQEEGSELLEALGDGSRSIHKPWSSHQLSLRTRPANRTDKVKSEAIDLLCFALNVCLAAGLNPENIEKEYDKVLSKNLSRIKSGIY